MVYWIIWFIGIGITIVTRILLNLFTDKLDGIAYEEVDNLEKGERILLHVLSIISIALVGGIAVAKFLGQFAAGKEKIEILLWIGLIIISALPTYLVGFFVIGLYRYKSVLSHVIFALVFITSIVSWMIPITQYNRNIEISEEKIIEKTEERYLISFCNIPVQDVSGSVGGGSALGFGYVEGNIETNSQLPYWYVNKKGEGLYDSVPAKDSKIIFIDENEKPSIKIIHYAKLETKKNHNNGKEKTSTIKKWVKYEIYLPETIKQYNIGK